MITCLDISQCQRLVLIEIFLFWSLYRKAKSWNFILEASIHDPFPPSTDSHMYMFQNCLAYTASNLDMLKLGLDVQLKYLFV